MSAVPSPENAGSGGAAVSVIIPCYRCAVTVERAVESVHRQTLRPSEVILVDDASGDGTLAILQRLREQHGHRWIRIISLPENAGPAGARNAGWEVATGKWIAFLDADDAWHPKKLEIQIPYLENHPDIVLCGHSSARLDLDPRTPEITEPVPAMRISYRRLLLGNTFVTPSVVVRCDIPLRFSPDGRHMEDHLLWMRIACAGYGVAMLNSPLAFLFKAPFGEAGASARIWAMGKADLDNYLQLYREGSIGTLVLCVLWAFSLAKFLRRLVIAAVPALRARQQPR